MTHLTPDYFVQFGILTGSRAFGVANDNSDYDIAISLELFNQIMTHIAKPFLLGNDSGYSTNNRLRNKNSAKFKLDSGEVINFIAYDTLDALEAIETINFKMCELPFKILDCKATRHSAFEELIDIHMTDMVLGISNNNSHQNIPEIIDLFNF